MSEIVVVMGVSGSGKSTLARDIAQRHGATFLEGDDFHPPANKAKMAAGEPLTDADRWGWLDALGRAAVAGQGRVVLSCSALKRAYRDRLRAAGPMRFLFLDAPQEVIAARMALRQGHYMPLSLLASQFATLEPPGPDETDVTRLDGRGTADEVMSAADAALARIGWSA